LSLTLDLWGLPMEEAIEKRRADLEIQVHMYEKATKQQLSSYAATFFGAALFATGLVFPIGVVLTILSIALIVVGVIAVVMAEYGRAKLPSLRRQLDDLNAEVQLSSIKRVRFCSSCGHELLLDAKYCESCGRKLREG